MIDNLNKAIEFLAKEQQKDGSFLSYTSPDVKNFKGAKVYHSVFPSTLILLCLSELNAEKIKTSLVNFLLSQKGDYWSFNYWARNSKEAKIMPYPDDLDDTFCALAGIYKEKPEVIDGDALAKITSLLVATEKKEGGPYCAWLVPKNSDEKWRDVDLAVNSNIAYFLFLQEISLPKIKKMVENAIDNKKYYSPYYPSAYPIIYFISRWYRGKKKQKIIDFILKKKKNGYWENPLNTALAVSSLLNFGVQAQKISLEIDYLLKNQQKDGLWKPHAFWIDLIRGGKTYYAGSSALTTAFCLEAINKYEKISNYSNYSNYSKKILNPKLLKKEKEIYGEIIEKYKQRFSEFSKDFQNDSLAIMDKIVKRNKAKDITLLPYFFAESLRQNLNFEFLNSDLFIRLGEANLYGWVAYTIYDDFFDKEEGANPKMLSIANVCLRESADIFKNILPENNDYQKLCRKIFDEIDGANYKETSKYNYDTLAEKSMGHALGPLAIIFAIKASGADIKNLIAFFRNYIIARQLNDDAHDWEEDLKKGVLTPATLLLHNNNASGTRYIKEKQKIQEIYWRKIIPILCKEILSRVKLARKMLNKISVIKDKVFFENLLQIAENSANTALKERKETIKFLKVFEE